MLTKALVREDKKNSDYLLGEALLAPFLSYITDREIAVGIYYALRNRSGTPVEIRVATEVEKLKLGHDVILTIGAAESTRLDTYDLIATIADQLSAIEVDWRGGKDDPTPVILIKPVGVMLKRDVMQYFPESKMSDEAQSFLKHIKFSESPTYPCKRNGGVFNSIRRR